jgi:hypothetical protein
MKKILSILFIAFTLTSAAQNIWRAPSVFEQPVNFKAAISQTSGTDSLNILTPGLNSTLSHGLGTLLLNNTKAVIGIFNATGYRVAATTASIQHQQGTTDSLVETFTNDTMNFTATVAAYKFTPPLDANSVTGFWRTSGNAGTNFATNFIGTTDEQPLVLKANNGGYPVAVFTNESFNVADSANDVDKFIVDVLNNQSEFKTSLRIKDGTEGAGKVFTSDSAGYGSWQGGIIYDSLSALTGETVTLTNNSTHILAASSTIVSVTWSFPTGSTGDVLDVENMQIITTLNITGTGTGTITAAKITNTKTAGLKTFHNYEGNWY